MKKSDSKGWILYDSTDTMLQKGKNKELQNRLVGSGAGERGLTTQEHKENLKADLNTLYLYQYMTVCTCFSKLSNLYIKKGCILLYGN